MRENRYDDEAFFFKYGQMERSLHGLSGAGEWYALKPLLPDFQGKRVLDLGCGYGWHCAYAMEQGAKKVVGVDISERMLAVARAKTASPNIEYLCAPMEDISFAPNSFDAVISSLAFHYVADFNDLCRRVYAWLAPGGAFVFSVEHPVFTAEGSQQWTDDASGRHLHWPVDRYYEEGRREAVFLGERVIKYHRTLHGYVNALLNCGFSLTGLIEPQPQGEYETLSPEMRDEFRRPMMLLLAAEKA
jgi:SAM-dependent methyltransferase